MLLGLLLRVLRTPLVLDRPQEPLNLRHAGLGRVLVVLELVLHRVLETVKPLHRLIPQLDQGGLFQLVGAGTGLFHRGFQAPADDLQVLGQHGLPVALRRIHRGPVFAGLAAQGLHVLRYLPQGCAQGGQELPPRPLQRLGVLLLKTALHTGDLLLQPFQLLFRRAHPFCRVLHKRALGLEPVEVLHHPIGHHIQLPQGGVVGLEPLVQLGHRIGAGSHLVVGQGEALEQFLGGFPLNVQGHPEVPDRPFLLIHPGSEVVLEPLGVLLQFFHGAVAPVDLVVKNEGQQHDAQG